MKKVVVAILMVTVLYNALLPMFFYKIHAGSVKDDVGAVLPQMTENIFQNEIINNNTGVFNGEKRPIETTSSQGAAGATIFFDIINVIPTVCNVLMSVAAYPLDNVEASEETGETSVDKINRWFSISDTVFGKISIFDIDFSKSNSSTPAKQNSEDYEPLNPGEEQKEIKDRGRDVTNIIKSNVAKWFVAMRNLVIVILLAILIYIGIRMAISSIAAEKSKYKKMLIDWLTSLIIVYLLNYIIFFAIGLSDSLVKILNDANTSINKNLEEILIVGDKKIDEKDLFQDGNVIVTKTGLIEALKRTNGWNILYLSIVYWVLIYYQIKFFFLYLKRFLTVGFLIIISPLISVTYAIDKVGDGRAQAFSSWMKEFLVNVFIQPLHAILYLVFMTTAYEIAFIAPIIAVFFLAALSRGEKVVKEILNIRGLTSIHSMSETMGLKLFKQK